MQIFQGTKPIKQRLISAGNGHFVRFLLVGGLNTVFGYLLFSLLIFLNLPYYGALFLSYLLGILFNFKTTGTLVFRNRDNRLIIRFIGVYVVTYCITAAALKIFSVYQVDMYRAGAMVFPFSIAFSFLLNKKLVFKSPGTCIGQPPSSPKEYPA